MHVIRHTKLNAHDGETTPEPVPNSGLGVSHIADITDAIVQNGKILWIMGKYETYDQE